MPITVDRRFVYGDFEVKLFFICDFQATIEFLIILFTIIIDSSILSRTGVSLTCVENYLDSISAYLLSCIDEHYDILPKFIENKEVKNKMFY